MFNKDLLNAYDDLHIKPKLNDIVYLGAYYKWMSNPFSWGIKKDKYKIIDLKVEIPNIWVNYLVLNLRTNETHVQQTSACMYVVDIFDNLRNKNVPVQMSIFDFI